MHLRKRLNDERAKNMARGEAIIAASEARAAADAADTGLTAEEMAELATLRTRRTEIDSQLAELNAQRDAGAAPGSGTQAGTVPSIQVHDNAEDKPFRSMGEFLQEVAAAAPDHPNRTVSPRLASLQADATGFAPRVNAAASGANQANPADGGFLVKTQYSDVLLARAREESPILGMCTPIPIGAGYDKLELPVIDETSRATGSRWGGVQVYRRAEAGTVTATKPAFGRWSLDASDIMGIAYATDRILGNAPALQTVFQDAFASEFAFKVTDEIIRGVGGEQCLGIIGSPATYLQAIESGQTLANGAVVTENISNMWTHVPTRSKSRGVWLINTEVNPDLDRLSIAAGTGALEPRFVTYDQNGAVRIKGRPVLELEQCSARGTIGDFMFADLSEYIVAPKGGLDEQESMHVRFIYGEMTFRWTYSINGRPAWLSKKTAYKGSADQAPFVTLSTRS